MKNSKNFNLFLMDGEVTGRIKCTLANWTGLAFKVPSSLLGKCKDRSDLNQSGIYFLFGKNDKEKNEEKATTDFFVNIKSELLIEDIHSSVKNIYEYSNAYPNIDKEKLAYSIIGADKSMPSDYLIDMNVELEKVECNFTDLCDDADAIGISELIKNKKFNKNILTDSLKEYYNNLNISKRYNQYSRDGLDLRTPELIYKSVKEKFSGFMEKIMFDVFNTLVGDASDEDKDLAYKAFGDYIYRKLRDPNFS